MNTQDFHPGTEIPTSFKPGRSYTCGACGTKNGLEVSTNSDGEVIGVCYSDDCYL